MQRWFFPVLAAVAVAVSVVACEGEGGGAAGADVSVGPQLRTRTGEVTLKADEGLVFATGELLTGAAANTRTADLMAYRHGDGLELQAGTPDGFMAVERLGGNARTYASLAEVPEEPDPALRGMLAEPEPGEGAAVRGNVTDGHARIRVTAVPFGAAPSVAIEYEAFWYE